MEEINFSDGMGFFQGKVLDISSKGMQIEAMRNFHPGMELTVTLPVSPPLKVRGKVRWVRRHGLRCRAGLRFIDLGQPQQVRLGEILKGLCWQSSR